MIYVFCTLLKHTNSYKIKANKRNIGKEVEVEVEAYSSNKVTKEVTGNNGGGSDRETGDRGNSNRAGDRVGNGGGNRGGNKRITF